MFGGQVGPEHLQQQETPWVLAAELRVLVGFQVGGAEEPCAIAAFQVAARSSGLANQMKHFMLNIKINNIPLCKFMLPVFAVCSVAPSQPRGELSAPI
jgi:hypothetical protein